MQRSAPDIAVVVPSHNRPLRLRWLLNALEDQTLDRGRWEVIVGHDCSGAAREETETLLRSHPLARAGVLRHAALAPDTAPPGANRNAAWRITEAPLIAFTDDDCRPPPDWLERALDAAQAHPGAIVQGATQKDPDEEAAQHATHFHSQRITPPTPWAECCNIVYPRELLERLGGFDEVMYTGEDTDLAMRAKKAGAAQMGARHVLTYHAVVEVPLHRKLWGMWRWKDLPGLIRKHPEMRDHFPARYFWKRTHFWFPFAIAGAILERRNPLWAVLVVPWVVHSAPAHGTDPRGRIREISELPSRAATDAMEYAALIRGSIKHRSLLL